MKMNTLQKDLELIENVEEEIKFFLNSDLKMQILANLYIESSTPKELETYTQSNYTTITTHLNKLEQNNIIHRENDTYHLEKTAKLKLLNIILLEHNLYFLHEFQNFLNNHKVKNNRLKILSALPYIENIELVQATNINPDIATETIEENMMARGAVKSVCIYLHPNCNDIIAYMMMHKTDFEVIVPLHLAQFIIQHATQYTTDRKVMNKRFNIKPIIDEELNIALVTSPEKLVLGFVRQEGKFNKSCCFVSNDENVISWGYSLFKEYETLKHGYLSIKELIEKNNQEGE